MCGSFSLWCCPHFGPAGPIFFAGTAQEEPGPRGLWPRPTLAEFFHDFIGEV